MRNSAKFRPPSWISFTRVWTTHEGYLVVLVFVTVQNLVGTWNRCSNFDNVLVVIFCALCLSLKMPIHAKINGKKLQKLLFRVHLTSVN